MQKFSDEPVTVHESCGGSVRKLMSAPAFQFKGTGWYVTDYGKGGKKPETNGGDSKANVDKKSGATGDSKADASKSDSKSEGKSEASKESKSESSSKSDSATSTPSPSSTNSGSSKSSD